MNHFYKAGVALEKEESILHFTPIDSKNLNFQ